ncbi:molecular chaperone DnaJ [Paenibacillus donghaensis]|uniref:Uncharacterized protein n=1 Tax=Paenibacillus donghaensis TaxID=414771 RepID=A0A2Z2KJ36_9BACL|nr:molecular chaperone DnaJ [Paenibacillus donghaensis]ASA25967.1 hypothetical protein B9T62_37800 [Paenibacillus donghaensis]
MDELKAAYQRLGVSEDVTKEELDKQFDLLIRKSRSNAKAGDAGKQQESEYEEDFKAIRYILNARREQEIEEATQKRLAKWGKLGGTVEKTERFFRLYKVHVLLSLIALAIVIGGAALFTNHRTEQKRLASLPPLDLSIMFLGNYQLQDESGSAEALNKAILAAFPEWKRVETKVTYLPSGEGGGMMDSAYLQKAVAELSMEKPDIYVLDDWSFEWLGKQTVLGKLDEQAAGKWKDLIKEGLAKQQQTEEDTAPHIYGMDLTTSALSADLPLNHGELIAGVRYDAARMEKAEQFIERFLSEVK